MLKKFWISIFITAFIFHSSLAVEKLTEVEIKTFKRYMLPLPQKIKMENKTIVPVEDLAISLGKSGPAGKNAANLLIKSIKDKIGKSPSGKKFKIIAGIIGSDGKINGTEISGWEKLKKLSNNEQAYIIQTVDDKALIVAALNDKGLFYGLTTLRQLLEGGMSKDRISIPLVEITDWPDMKERGIWNGHSTTIIPFLASIKINYDTDQIRWGKIEKDKKLDIKINKKYQIIAKENAFNLCPKITHLNFLHNYGLYEAYPELAGKGKQAFQKHNGTHGHQVPCASNPLLRKLLVEVMENLAGQDMRDATVWTSEYLSNCECDKCKKIGYRMGQFTLEAKAINEARNEVRKTYPDFDVRIFFSPTQFKEGSSLNDIRKFLQTIPNEVRIERCCYLKRVKNSPRDFITMPPCDEKRQQGGRLISYMLPPAGNQPIFKVLAYKDHFENLLRRGYEGGYSQQSFPDKINREINNPMMYAIAEWGWNNKGRDVKEFGEAWAVREGFTDPEKVGRWFELLAPVELDIYGSCYAPSGNGWTRYISEEVPSKKKRLHSPLGSGFFRYYPNKENFSKKILQLEEALKLAHSLQNKILVGETKLALSFVKQSKTGNLIADLLCKKDLNKTEVKSKLKKLLAQLKVDMRERNTAYDIIDSALSPPAKKYYKVLKQKKQTEGQITQIMTALKPLTK